MLLLSKPKLTVNILIDDYVLRVVENKGHDLKSIRLIEERELPRGCIQQGKIVDELGFYQFMKEFVRYEKLKHRAVRFLVPNQLVIMRHVDVPLELEADDVNNYFLNEVGSTLHFPFSSPLLDVFIPDQCQEPGQQESRKGILFAVPEEEMTKYIGVFEDVGWQVAVIDVQPLSVYRYFQHHYSALSEKAYLLFECNLLTTHISIFCKHLPEFNRSQQLDLQISDWQADTKYSKYLNWTFKRDHVKLEQLIEDEILELQRIMDFYCYSLYKGEKTVDEIILYGDMPILPTIAARLESITAKPVTMLAGNVEGEDKDFVPVLGLALKGETSHATRD
ncbi:type IV pilus biogenesis protein PilM [Virgibacillus dokdonensis]|uniref:type IV pilus biogenesis protein PilM n=1 Tax=Virgibacillus dokdonensis TaxID=302167 RepID=UPI00098AADAF|nr:pilus assembly protein PilM [Virgibacillus dokdonensis]